MLGLNIGLAKMIGKALGHQKGEKKKLQGKKLLLMKRSKYGLLVVLHVSRHHALSNTILSIAKLGDCRVSDITRLT